MQNWKKLLSLLLVLTMLVGMMPAVFAAEEEPATEPEQAEELLTEDPAEPEVPTEPETPEDPDTPEDPAEPDPSVTPEDPADPVDPTDPDAPTEPEEPEVPEEPEDPEEPEEEPEEEEEEPSELPYGFPGMGEGYELSEEELAAKLALAGLPEALAGMTPGADYVEGELIAAAATEEYAQQTADAYNAELLDYGYGFALIRLREATVLQAVECAADPDIPLPAVEPNWLSRSVEVASAGADFSVQGETMDVYDWAGSDPYLNPSNGNFQYHHFIMDDFATWGAYTGAGSDILMLSQTGADQSDSDLSSHISGDSGGSYSNGTKLAKTAVGTLGNSYQGAGVAPDAGLRVVQFSDIYNLASKLNSWSSTYYRIILVDAAFPYTTQSLETAVKNVVSQGAVIIAPMGDYGNSTRCYPAAYDGVIAVAATDSSGALAPYSCNGAWCTISAPGDTCYGSGTSYAAALVAGAAALYHQANGYPYDMSGFEKKLKKAATPGGAGAGIVNTANLFGGKPEAPEIRMDSDGGLYEGTRVDGYGRFWFADPNPSGGGDSKTVLYTLDGSAPSVKNGEYKNGDLTSFNQYDNNSYKDLIAWYFGGSIKDPKIGKTYTIKAITVNGMGIPSAVSTRQFKLAGTKKDITLTLEGPKAMVAGQSATLKAVAKNNKGYPVAQEFEWDYYSTCGAKLSGGKVTTVKNKSGSISITVKLKNTSESAFLNIPINATPTVASITLKDSSSQVLKPFTLMAGDAFTVYPDARDKDNHYVNSAAEFVWTSSNESVLKVTYEDPYYNYCNIQAVGAGTAVLKATAQDGSNKSASIKITVKAKVTSIYISPKNGISYNEVFLAPGGSVTIQKELYPSNAADKSVHWYATGNYLEIPIDQKALAKGIVKLDKGYTPTHDDEKITVQCFSSDWSAWSNELYVYIIPKVTSMAVTDIHDDPVKTITLCTEDLGYNQNMFDIRVTEEYFFNGHSETRLNGLYGGNYWRSLKVETSNWNVAGFSSYYGAVRAYGPGTAKITVTSSDGSKKYSFNVKVVVPVSDVEIRSAAPGGTNVVAYGKSFKMKAVTKSLYGKPTDAKMNWQISYGHCYDGSNFYSAEEVKSVLSLSQSGVLSTKAAAATFHGGIQYVVIGVQPQNYSGSGLYYNYTVCLGQPIDKIITYSLGGDNTAHVNGSWEQSVSFYLYDKSSSPILYYSPENLVSVTSSNPKLLSTWVNYVSSSGDYCEIRLRAANPDTLTAKEQSTKVTVKVNDGSNKSFTFTVKLSA